MKSKGRWGVLILVFLACGILAGCANTQNQLLQSEAGQVQLRGIQTRSFDTLDKEKMMRSIISCLQDLDFLIEKADFKLGTVTATKFVGLTTLKMTVTVRDRGTNQLLVRANAQYGIKAVITPEPYQDFFNALSKAVFLTANQVD